ncbi:hypothetical protein GCM10010919_16740 [Alishewanella longhuensis]|uniref:MSHA biogenesis protein MshP n=1 Tax=Alishewanella longhuensis TaxID=1091037 RepID=A0ABQ3KXM9_9ALTE|nr:type II secretory pathway component [Alishewanella longhuensis]GHG67777.1 hypothetical protein GCM10010919_16740 [Alishewanella longhuensis]
MCPNSLAKRQTGSALVVAIFIIVVMLALILSLSRLSLSSSESLVYEVQGTRAFLAAQSGLELGLTAVLPRTAAGGCFNSTLSFTDSGLIGCRAQITCSQQALPADSLTTVLYQVTSIGVCSADDFVTSRTLVIEVRQ